MITVFTEITTEKKIIFIVSSIVIFRGQFQALSPVQFTICYENNFNYITGLPSPNTVF